MASQASGTARFAKALCLEWHGWKGERGSVLRAGEPGAEGVEIRWSSLVDHCRDVICYLSATRL